MSDLSWLNPTPHAIAVYASQTTVASGHATLATKRTLLLTWAGLPPAGSRQLCLAHSFNHLVGVVGAPAIRATGFTAVAPKGATHAPHEIRCCRGLQSTNAHSR